ncbi:MAG TPA: long-chain fatty acid--CoA ligase [Saprospiraceae bacterium]|jgi:long-chain acyl-CoA synthetase|nr:long-chain fatty acid--CoA ligase [Saprospiraceae bacterium]HMT51694.1 long-chain fatty acid--CoA ligase [Saprospiraceae bacterium]HMT69842.1 long-chain fatty acid--CoA ligase [Saprospiraceae bacterium]
MQVTRLFDYINKQFDEGTLEKFAGNKTEQGWKFYSTSEVIMLSRKLASGLIDLGVEKGDKIGIVVYKNRPEWLITDLAIQYIGAIGVPMYPTISSREYEYIMNEAEVKVCFIGTGDLYDKVSAAQAHVNSLKHIICFDKQGGRPFWLDYMNDTNLELVEKISQTVQSEDLATIIYTSGTTGNPKGVMLSHLNIISVVESCCELLPVRKGDRVLSFLPLCHIFERAVLYVYTSIGAEIYFTGTDNLGGESGDLVAVKPNFFTTVPRLLEKVYEKIYNKGMALTGLKKKLFFWALNLTDDFEHDKTYTGLEGLKRKIADKLIFSKWRAALGDNVKSIATGAAACPAKIARVFSAAGITITEGYGLTETSPVLTLNHYYGGSNKIGTVGVPLEMCDIVIDRSEGDYNEGEGEIIAAGPNIMMGYYKQPQQTEEVFKKYNGKTYFRTGDIGTFVDGPNGQKYLKITDRKKELLKTSGGKYVAPAPIESLLKEDFLIENVMVVGDHKKFVSALIVPSQDALKAWCEEHHVEWTSLDDIIHNETVLSRYQHAIDKINVNFSHIEQIKKFALIPTTWEATRNDGTESELTPTMKLKRRVILSKFADAIDKLYA